MSGSNPLSARAELGFLRTQHVAEETMIDIIPRFSSPPLRFLSQQIGPFRTNLPIAVPLWLAINLRIAQRCSISPPAWLDAQSLLHHLSLEKANPTFQPLPFHYQEIARLLLQHARDDLQQPERVEEALSDVVEARRKKIHEGLMSWSAQQPTTTKLNHVAAMEVESIRGLTSTVLRQFYALQHPQAERDSAAQHRSSGAGQQEEGQRRTEDRREEAVSQESVEENGEGAAAAASPPRSQHRSAVAPAPPPTTERLRRYR